MEGEEGRGGEGRKRKGQKMQTRPLGQGRPSGLLEHSILLSCSRAPLMKMNTCSEPPEPCTLHLFQKSVSGPNRHASFHPRAQSSF